MTDKPQNMGKYFLRVFDKCTGYKYREHPTIPWCSKIMSVTNISGRRLVRKDSH